MREAEILALLGQAIQRAHSDQMVDILLDIWNLVESPDAELLKAPGADQFCDAEAGSVQPL